jgi:hypothetical protein
MRGIDWDTAIAAREHWAGRPKAGFVLCALLADLDALLDHLGALELRPGDAIGCCPACGGEHRWVLIKELTIHAIAMRPDRPTRLMRLVDASLEPVRETYGGREKFETMQKEAAAFFARVKSQNRYVIR